MAFDEDEFIGCFTQRFLETDDEVFGNQLQHYGCAVCLQFRNLLLRELYEWFIKFIWTRVQGTCIPQPTDENWLNLVEDFERKSSFSHYKVCPLNKATVIVCRNWILNNHINKVYIQVHIYKE